MKQALFALSALFLCPPQSALAGPVYGTVRIGQAAATNVSVNVACPSFRSPSKRSQGVTDARGSYSMFVEANGRCEMQVQRGNQAGAPFEVFVSNNAIRFDVTIDGSLNRVR